MAKKVAIVGAGASGIPAIKCCLDEGLVPVCFEQTDHIGGLWYYTDKVDDDVGCVMKTTVSNTSKEMMCYSDFPIPGSYPNYMHNTKVIEYFNMYVDKFDLKKYIRFHTKIVSIEPTLDFKRTGQWAIEFMSEGQCDHQEEVYDAVMLCSGHHASKQMPIFPGTEDFSRVQTHAHDYRDHRGYEDKRVLVVGIGNSGADVAVELSKICKQVYLSTRRGAWIRGRLLENGKAFDMAMNRRFNVMVKGFLPRQVRNHIMESRLNKSFNHADYGLRPKHRFDSQSCVVNGELPIKITCGAVVIKPNVSKLTKTGVEFEDGTVEEDIDVVIYATGYTFGLSYVNHPGFAVNDNVPHLYKYMFAPSMAHHTMAAIGFIQPIGAIMPISELQCRLAARVYKGLVRLPSREKMDLEIGQKAAKMSERYIQSPRFTIQVDWIPFMDELAELVGCRPNILNLVLKDPKLAAYAVFGPCTPYQYRLNGPGAWSGARKAILTQWDRVAEPLKTRQAARNDDTFYFKRLFVLSVLAALILYSVLA